MVRWVPITRREGADVSLGDDVISARRALVQRLTLNDYRNPILSNRFISVKNLINLSRKYFTVYNETFIWTEKQQEFFTVTVFIISTNIPFKF